MAQHWYPPQYDPRRQGNLNTNLRRGSAFPYIVSGVAGLGAGLGSREQAGTATSTQRSTINDPLVTDIRNRGIRAYEKVLDPTYVPGITAQQSNEANTVWGLRQQTAREELSARGIDPRSPAYAAAMRNIENQRTAAIQKIRSDAPLLEHQISQEALSSLGPFLANIPTETETTGTQQETMPGNVAGNILANAANTFTSLAAYELLGGGGAAGALSGGLPAALSFNDYYTALPGGVTGIAPSAEVLASVGSPAAGGGGFVGGIKSAGSAAYGGIKSAGAALSSGVTATAEVIGSALGIGAAGGALVLGGGAVAAIAIPWIKSQAHWEANDIVQNFQNPFGEVIINTAELVDSGGMEVQAGIDFLKSNWKTYKAEVKKWAGNSSDKNLVMRQSFKTLAFIETLIGDWEDFLARPTNA